MKLNYFSKYKLEWGIFLSHTPKQGEADSSNQHQSLHKLNKPKMEPYPSQSCSLLQVRQIHLKKSPTIPPFKICLTYLAFPLNYLMF